MRVEITKDIRRAVDVIRQGRVVALPTGTAYGLAVDALQGHALQRLRILKHRLSEKTFTVFLLENLWDQFFEISDVEQALLEKHRHQPLTLLLRAKEPIAHLAQNGLVGLRIIDHPLMQQLADAVNVPLTATSANIFDHLPCNSPVAIQAEFPQLIDERSLAYDLSLGCILDGGELPPNPPTTIAKLENDEIKIIRQGTLKL